VRSRARGRDRDRAGRVSASCARSRKHHKIASEAYKKEVKRGRTAAEVPFDFLILLSAGSHFLPLFYFFLFSLLRFLYFLIFIL
jgi:hypothetical protein